MQAFFTSLRITAVTLAVCVVGYTGLILGIAQLFTPDTANGWLIVRPDGSIAGSRQIAQPFTQPAYFWPRPSAVDYDAAAAGGSNKSPTSRDVTERAIGQIARYGAGAERPLPPELATASGAGLDPHISEHAALYQAARVAAARGLPRDRIERLIRDHAVLPGGLFTPERIVNVLELNLALDALGASDR